MNVFLVDTPHQLLNATEAKKSLATGDALLVAILYEQYPQRAYELLIQTMDWDDVRYVPAKSGSPGTVIRWLRDHASGRLRDYNAAIEQFGLRRRLNVLPDLIGHVSRLLLGNYAQPYMRHFANVLRPDEVVLLDDGTATILINEMRKKTTRGSDRQRTLMETAIDRFVGFDRTEPNNVVFFTAYDLAVRPGDRVVKHRFEFLRGLAGAAPRTEEILFLGQTFFFEGLSSEKYLRYMSRVKQFYAGGRLVYVPHKLEPPERIARIEADLGLLVRRFDVPIEYQLTFGGTRPLRLASFCSSALENCRMIFGDDLHIDSFYIDLADFSMEPEFIRSIYGYFESKRSDHFRLIKLP